MCGLIYSLSFEIDKNYSLTLPWWRVCVTGGHVTSCNQGLRKAEAREPGNKADMASVCVIKFNILNFFNFARKSINSVN